MPTLLWDASALVKRYSAELGSDSVDALFALAAPEPMVVTVLGYTETWAGLLRKHNRGELTTTTFVAAATLLQDEVLDGAEFVVLPLEFDAVLAGVTLISRHSLNASDAAILTVFLRYAQSAIATGTTCVLVASDQRLLRAADAEGLRTINPETVAAADVAAFLAGAS